MIAFDLECGQGHVFEGWFNNIQSFEDQLKKKLVVCPYCNDTNVRKVISPVSMKSTSRKERSDDGINIDYRKLAVEVLDYIHENFRDVGSDFSKEALKMHYGVTEKENIRGSATEEEERLLKDEGIDFLKIPVVKIDDKKKN